MTDSGPVVHQLPLAGIDTPTDDYQRELRQSRVDKIRQEFDPAICGTLLVACRGDRWVVIDGQHRLAALRLLGYTDWPCVIANTETVADEARQFAVANTDRVRATAWNLYRARLVAGDPVIVDVQAVCDSLGVLVGQGGDHHSKARKTRAVQALERVYRSGGASHLAEVIRVCVNSWPGDSRHLDADILLGISSFLTYYGDHQHYDRERAVEKFSRLEMKTLRQRASVLGPPGGAHNVHGFMPGVVKALVEAYNWRLRSNELPEPTQSGWKKISLAKAS